MSENKKFSILIVDDTPKNIQIAASILKETGYQVAFARDGQTALASVKSANFDFVGYYDAGNRRIRSVPALEKRSCFDGNTCDFFNCQD